MRWILAMLTVLVFAGCGDVTWFPDKAATGGATGNAPDSFTFPLVTNITPGQIAQSAAVTIKGTQTAGWSISVADAGGNVTGSQYSISGRAATSTPGTILPNETLTISHKTGTGFATIGTTKVTVGTFTTTFQSQTTNQ